MEKELVNNQSLLQKFPGKGGWTYIALPDIQSQIRTHFGVVKVHGFIDDYNLGQCNLMPFKKGVSILPVKAAIRKAIDKQAGDTVHVVLFTDVEEKWNSTEEFIKCLQDEPDAYHFFSALAENEKKAYLDWIGATTNETIQIKRMAESIDRLHQKLLLKK